jgi:hypothetical protein
LLIKLKQSIRFSSLSYPAFLQDTVGAIDWSLLAFLLMFLNVKMAIKAAAILIIYFLNPDFKFGFRIKNSRLPNFYLAVIIIGLIDWIIQGLFTNLDYDFVLLTGISFWLLCILACHQVKLSVEKNKPETIHRTLIVFFILNSVVSIFVYLKIVLATGTFNPFTYQGEFQKYFIGTGDYIKGISFDTSTTNAVINAFGVIYFLYRNNPLLCLVCMIVLLFTGSNFTNIILLLVFLYIFIFQSNKIQKSLVVICFVLLMIFWVKISPQNGKYIEQWYAEYTNKHPAVSTNNSPLLKPINNTANIDSARQSIATRYFDSLDKINKKKNPHKIIGGLSPKFISSVTAKPEIPQPDINTRPFQYQQDTTATQKKLIRFINENKASLAIATNDSISEKKIPGKILALQQTVGYLKQHPRQILTGTGMGNFSSKLAFRATAMNIAGGYPGKLAYISNNFKANHFDLYLYYFSRLDKFHSLTNNPNSVYDQLLSEYGIIGFSCFLLFYIGFFARHIRQLTYGIPLLLLMTAAFAVEYWFEQLSVIILFELLLFLNIKENKTTV